MQRGLGQGEYVHGFLMFTVANLFATVAAGCCTKNG